MNEKKKVLKSSCLLLILLILKSYSLYPQNSNDFLIVSYNVENLFDCEDDSLTLDDEFLPAGMKHWTPGRFYDKIGKINQVLSSIGGWNQPAVIGLCEVENRDVLEKLVYRGLKEYRIVHVESHDRRGIDVAMLYHASKFKPIYYEAIRIIHPTNPDFRTRDILYLKGQMASDTLHLFMNHWPSKFGGVIETKPLRALTGRTLRSRIDSILHTDSNAKILAMGDFNDEPGDPSVTEHLKTTILEQDLKNNCLYNLSASWPKTKGTHKHQGEWSIIDQLIVSGGLLETDGLHVVPGKSNIYDAAYLLIKDEKFTGKKPNRTYNGYQYVGGFSDHLPVYIYLKQ